MLFATPVGESHEFGLLMSCLLAAEQQYNCYYLGADVPGKDIVEAARRLGVDIVVLSILKSPSDPETLEDLNLILADLAGEDLQVWVAGRGVGFWARHNPERPDNSVLISNLDHFYQLAMQWQHDH
jgi:MerR family transcriptional regulator, light-induced transcriptional regulator